MKEFIASCKKYGVKPGLYASASANAFMKVDNPGLVLSGNAQEQEKYKEIVKAQLKSAGKPNIRRLECF